MELSEIRNKNIVITNNTNVNRTVKWIKRLSRLSATSPQIKTIAKELSKSNDPVKAVFDFAYENVVYEPDPDNSQNLKSAERSLKDKKGNCADYVILMSALLLNMGIKHQFRVLKIDSDSNYDHILLIANGKVLDPVPGHQQDGTDTYQNRPFQGKYNFLTPSLRYKDFNMSKLAILGRTSFTRVSRFREPLNGVINTALSKCKKRCNSVFPNNKDLKKGCQNKCKSLKTKQRSELADQSKIPNDVFLKTICGPIIGYNSDCTKIISDVFTPPPPPYGGGGAGGGGNQQPTPFDTNVPFQPPGPIQAGFDIKTILPILLVAGGALLLGTQKKGKKRR